MRVFLRSARKLLFAFLKHSKPSCSPSGPTGQFELIA